MWIEPKTDWSVGDYFNYEDMNRIAGNVNEVIGINNKNMDWYTTETATAEAWRWLVEDVTNLKQAWNVEGDIPDMTTTPENFNAMETLILKLYERKELRLRQPIGNIYAGQNIYTSALPENYVRGI